MVGLTACPGKPGFVTGFVTRFVTSVARPGELSRCGSSRAPWGPMP